MPCLHTYYWVPRKMWCCIRKSGVAEKSKAGGGQSAVQKEEKKTTEKIDACFDGGYTEGWCDRG